MIKKAMDLVDRFIAYLRKHQGISVVSGIGILACTTLLRTFIENYSNPEPWGGFTAWYIVLGFFLYYAGVMLLLTTLLSKVTKEKSSFTFGALILSSPVILTAPIFDLIISGGKGYCMSYLGDHGFPLIQDFFTYFGPLSSCGITPGIRIEIVLALIGIGFFVYRITKSKVRTVIAILGSYVILFTNLAASGIIVTISQGFGQYVNANAFFAALIHNSLLPTVQAYIHTPNIYMQNYAAGSIMMGRFSWVICLVTIFIVAYQENKLAFKAYVRDFRLTRVLYYWSLGLFGIWVAYQVGGYTFVPRTFPDILGYIVFFAILALGFTFAATVNDIVDIPIDTISNKHRPLVAGTLTIENYKAIAVILGLFIVSGALLLNYNLFIDTIVFHICFYLYSVPPLRLKKHFLSGGILLAWAGLSTVMAGYSLLAVYPQFNSFPLKLTLIIFCFLFIIVHIRDFKDIEGDSHEGIQTLPVVFGEKKARRIIGGAVLIAGILTGTALLSTFLGFALVLYVLSFSFWAILFFQKVDERIAFLFMYATVILAICML